MNRIKRAINFIRESIKKQIALYKSKKVICRRATKTKTVFATSFYIISFLALLPSCCHIILDMTIHGSAMLASFLMFRASEAI
jgi:hypothetical protein